MEQNYSILGQIYKFLTAIVLNWLSLKDGTALATSVYICIHVMKTTNKIISAVIFKDGNLKAAKSNAKKLRLSDDDNEVDDGAVSLQRIRKIQV